MISYLLLSKENVSEIERLYKDDFSDGWNKNMLNSAFETGRFMALGAHLDGRLVGIITASVGLDDADIESVYVRVEHRRKGIANELLNKIERELISRGIEKVLLEVRESNISARALYAKKGYADISVRKKYYHDGENAVVMVKELSE
jgi:ribosomal-protein-alanine N-acetyltransferase